MIALPKNPPGLTSVSYHAIQYGSTREHMLDGLARDRGWLRDLNTRDPADPSIALIDAWAISGDVLSFSAERIINESYLQTAQERRSIRSLARLIDYELRPGKAAEAWIAFTLETAAGAPLEVPIPVGVQIKSVPGPGETMATFETLEAITARPHLNAMLPRMTRPQTLIDVRDGQSALCLGVLNDIRRGDWLLLAMDAATPPTTFLHRAAAVNTDAAANRTRIDMALDPVRPVIQPLYYTIQYTAQQDFAGTGLGPQLFQNNVLGTYQNQSSFEDGLFRIGIPGYVVTLHLLNANYGPPLPPQTGLFRFRTRAGIFGHNVPAAVHPEPAANGAQPLVREMFNGRTVPLDTDFPDLRRGGWIAFVPVSGDPYIAKIDTVATATHRRGKLTARTSRVTVDVDVPERILALSTTEVAVLLDSVAIPLAALPITEAVAGSTIGLDSFYPGLIPGRPVIITGERADLAGIVQSETHVIDRVDMIDGQTVLVLRTAIVGPFSRDTVTINANVALAGHGAGETMPIGHGNGAVGGQSFVLPVNPLTHVGVPTPPGAAAALTIRVDGLLWTPTASLREAGPLDSVYALRHQEDGSTVVQFGDGVHGRRLPSGTNNVVASWRKGLGQTGMVRAGQLTLLAGAPQGVKSAVNPLPAYGAADGETIDDARRNAPLSVMTLGRIVTLTDYADFARAFIGVAKAHAIWSWSGSQRTILLTAAGIDGAPLAPRDLGNLTAAIAAASDRAIAVRIENYRPALFRLSAGIRVHTAYVPDVVVADIKRTLSQQFGFASRDVGQPVARSEVIAAMQTVPGVDWVDLDLLYRGTSPANAVALTAALPRSGGRNGGTVLPAELLTLHPSGADIRIIT
jgi:hypothetical protein